MAKTTEAQKKASKKYWKKYSARMTREQKDERNRKAREKRARMTSEERAAQNRKQRGNRKKRKGTHRGISIAQIRAMQAEADKDYQKMLEEIREREAKIKKKTDFL